MRSDAIKKGVSRAPARSMLKATGLTDADLERPLIAVANTWSEVTPCNYHLRRLAEKVKQGIRAAGGTPIEFNTIVVSDGIAMGTEGMKASLISREVVADSIELVVQGHLFDAVVALSGCDKTIPGTVMALARMNLPSLMLYGGSIMPGRFKDHDVTIQDVFEAVGACAAGRMSERRAPRAGGSRLVPGRVRAAASSPPTPCPPPPRCSAYRRWEPTRSRPSIHAKTKWRFTAASSSCKCTSR